LRARGWIWLLALALMAGFCLERSRRGGAVDTDLMAMLPATEQNPAAERALRVLASATGDRAIFLVGAGDPQRSEAAARFLGDRLARSGAFGQVTTTLPPLDSGAVLNFYLPYRFRLAGPDPADPATARDLAARITARLAAPQGGLSGISPAQDPLGEAARFLAGLPMGAMRLQIQHDLLVIRGPGTLDVLISGSLPGSAFDPAVQKRVIAAIRQAEADLRGSFPEARVLKTGALFYAADAREAAERETDLISGISMLCIVLLYLGVFRSLRHLLLGLACVAAGFITAAAVCLLVSGKLYLLTLVCGSSVMGVAVDYSFLYFSNHLGAGPGWRPRAALARLLPALAVGLGTTLLGYAALLVAPFPGLRQIALFSMVGLAGSFLTVLCVLPDLLGRPATPRPRLMAGLARRLRAGAGLARRPGTLLLLGCAAVLLAAAATRARVDDDVHGLIRPSRALRLDEARIRSLTGLSSSGCFFLVQGADEAQVLEREEALRARLASLVADGGLEGIQAISAFVPSPARQEAALAANLARLGPLAAALRAVGFRDSVAPALEAEMRASAGQPLTVAAWLRTPLAVPYRRLWLGPGAGGAASVVYPLGDPDGARLQQAAAGLPGVQWVDKAQSASRLLGHFRRVAAWALGGAVALVGLVLSWIYGARRAAAALAPALLGILLALAGLAATGIPVTLFSTLGLILVLGFGVDYTVFLLTGGEEDPSNLLGVALAGLATLVSYGLLAFSHTPALQGFALAATLGVLGSLLSAFLALGPRRPPARAPR